MAAPRIARRPPVLRKCLRLDVFARFTRARRDRPGSSDEVQSATPEPVDIFVTVGTELPFDRLVRTIDEWAGDTGAGSRVFAQIGQTDLTPANIRWSNFVEVSKFDSLFRSAELVVSHAGMGTILSALQYQQPLLVVPRRAALGEHRNDHQLATARRLSELGRVHVAIDETSLRSQLETATSLTSLPRIGRFADDALIDGLRDAIAELSGGS